MTGGFKVLRFEALLDLEVPRGKGRAGATPQPSNKALAMAAHIGRTSVKHPQVLVKVTSWGRSAASAAETANYISRDGEIPVETELGVVLTDAESISDAQRGWFLKHDRNRKARKTMNLVLAMPAGTDPQKVLEGGRRFARAEFSDRQYLLALHVPGTVHLGQSREEKRHPDHPHVHLQVKSLNDSGERLHVRPADLRRWREVFAESMREQGVLAHASSRLERVRDKDLRPKVRNLHFKKMNRDPAAERRRQEYHDAHVKYMGPLVKSDYAKASVIINSNPALLRAFTEAALMGQVIPLAHHHEPEPPSRSR